MKTEIKEMVANLEKDLEQHDNSYKRKMVDWYEYRFDALNNMKRGEEKFDSDRYHWFMRQCEVAGGKGMYEKLKFASIKQVRELALKDADRKLKNRNLMLAKKLEKAGVTEISDSEVIYSDNNAFDGLYTVETKQGRKAISINTIIAGGHNIQCIHHRTLVKIN